MQEEEKTVDIDTSGPDTEVEEIKRIHLTQQQLNQLRRADEPVDKTKEEEDYKTKSEKKESTEEKKDELKEYSEGVQRRIAKLTKKWREAERQKEEAMNLQKRKLS